MYKAIFSVSYEKLVKWLVSGRKNKGLSQRDLASLLEVHHSIVGKVEVCDRRLDVIEYLQFCRALDLDPIEGFQRMLRA